MAIAVGNISLSKQTTTSRLQQAQQWPGTATSIDMLAQSLPQE